MGNEQIQTVQQAAMIADPIGNFDSLLSFCDKMLKTQFLPQAIKTKEQAAAIIIMGRELGLPAMYSLQKIPVIQGKPSLGGEVMLSLAYQRIPGFHHSIIVETSEKCRIRFHRASSADYEYEYTMADARLAQLDGKDNWKKQAKTMLFHRCVSNGLRHFAPDLCLSLYTPDEVEEIQGTRVVNATITRSDSPVKSEPASSNPQELGGSPDEEPPKREPRKPFSPPRSVSAEKVESPQGAPQEQPKPKPEADRKANNEQIKFMLESFDKFGIPQKVIEQFLEKPITDGILESDLAALRKVYWFLELEGITLDEAFGFEPKAHTESVYGQFVEQNTAPISEPQKKRLYAISKEAGKTDKAVHQFLFLKFGIRSVSDLHWGESYEMACDWAENGAVEA